MQKERITVTLDPDLVARIDRLAEHRDESRSKFMEFLLEIGVEEQEQFHEKMASPVIGPIVQSIMDHPKLIAGIAKVIGEQLSPEEIARWQAAGPNLRRVRQRQSNERGRRTDIRPEGT